MPLEVNTNRGTKTVRQYIEDEIQDRCYDSGDLEKLRSTCDNLVIAFARLVELCLEREVLKPEDLGEIVWLGHNEVRVIK